MNVIGLDARREENMRTLAAFLLTNVPQINFDMNRFCNDCGTAGCAVGWGPVALNVERGPWLIKRRWGSYEFSHHYLVDDEASELMNDVWMWCFSEQWSEVDNSPHGAAQRILWVLDKGLPEDWEQQMYDRELVCYQQEPQVELRQETTHRSATPANLMICCAADK